MASQKDPQPGSANIESSASESAPFFGDDIAGLTDETGVTIPPRGDLSEASGPARHPTAAAAVPKQFDGYEVIAEIARGGMGIVYRAYQKSLDRVVALKTVLAGNMASAEAVELLQTEAKAAGKLNHPGIVPVYDVGECHGFHYFSMPLIDGVSLGDRVGRGPLDPDEAARLMRTAAETIQFAHDHKVIHRDLKPRNILIDAHNQPLIMDFGIAQRIERTQTPGEVNSLMGTAEYMPPEQAAGEATGPRSDVYSLGATLYCLLTGRPPFQSHTTLDTLLAVLQGNPIPPRRLNEQIPRDLELICLKCLQQRPQDRYQSARELADELGRFLSGEPVLVHPVGNIGTFLRWMRREPRNAAISAGLVVCFTAALAISVYYNYRLDTQRDIAQLAALEADLDKQVAVQSLRRAARSEQRALREREVAKELLAELTTAESGIIQALQYSILGNVCSTATKLSRATQQGQRMQMLGAFQTARDNLTDEQERKLRPLLDRIEDAGNSDEENAAVIRDSVELLIGEIQELWLTATKDSPQVKQQIREILYSRAVKRADQITGATNRRDVEREIEWLLDLVNAELFVVAEVDVYLAGLQLMIALEEWEDGQPPDSLMKAAAALRRVAVPQNDVR
ncbi:MAG: protein kinase [Planctomycetaceae bacterium]